MIFSASGSAAGTRPDYESLAAALDHYVEPEEVALTNLQLDGPSPCWKKCR